MTTDSMLNPLPHRGHRGMYHIDIYDMYITCRTEVPLTPVYPYEPNHLRSSQHDQRQ